MRNSCTINGNSCYNLKETTMKKTYIEPKMQEIRLNISNIICVSGLGVSNQTTTEAGVTDAESRGGRWFDDDEDY